MDAESGANGLRGELALKLRESLEEIFFARSIGGEFFRSDGVVEEGKKALKSGRHVIQIGNHGDVGSASPRGGDAGGCGVVSIDVQEAGGSYPGSVQEAGGHN